MRDPHIGIASADKPDYECERGDGKQPKAHEDDDLRAPDEAICLFDAVHGVSPRGVQAA